MPTCRGAWSPFESATVSSFGCAKKNLTREEEELCQAKIYSEIAVGQNKEAA
jgi:hypothetical protein